MPVAKHGNRAASSKSGAADTLGALGVKIGLAPEAVERSIREAGIGFMMAPTHHAAMRHVGPTRGRTRHPHICSICSGRCRTRRACSRQLIGVFSAAWLEPMAEVLRNLGSERVWMTHGADGLDEMSTTGVTKVVELKDGAIRAFEVTPEERWPEARHAGCAQRRRRGPQRGRTARRSRGRRATPIATSRVFNAAGALVVAGRAHELADGVTLADEALRSGAASRILEKLVSVSNG